MGELRQRLIRPGAPLQEADHAIDAGIGVGAQQLLPLRPRATPGVVLPEDMNRDAQVVRVASDLLAPRADGGQRLSHLTRRHPVDVQLIRVARRQSPGHVRSIAAHHDRYPGLLQALWRVDRVLDVGVSALERGVRRAPGLEHCADHAKSVRERGEPLARVREAIAVGHPLVALPARADAELHATTGDDVHGGDHLGHQRRVPISIANHDVPQPDAVGHRGERRERRE